MTEQHF